MKIRFAYEFDTETTEETCQYNGLDPLTANRLFLQLSALTSLETTKARESELEPDISVII